jgi:shikimate dehydrogenase
MVEVYGVLGWPVRHSRSPAMHNAAFRELHMDAVYVPFATEPMRLADAVRGLVALGIRGVNVTVPHKENIIPLLDDVDTTARAIGAVNTVTLEGERLIGSNTDAEGLVRSLRDQGLEPKGARVVVLGAGGAARAAVVGLGTAGADSITIAARRPEQAQKLVDELDVEATLSAAALDASISRVFEHATLLVQATSAPLDDGPEATRFASSLPLDSLPKDAWVTDLVYSPRETAVLRAAQTLGLKTVDGLGMLLMQGAIAFERWTGKKAPIEAMHKALS